MKKLLFLIVIVFLTPHHLMAQSFPSLWKQVKTATERDLPQTELELLQQIVEKAERESAYGHLMKAQLARVGVLGSLSPDSLLPAVSAMEQKERLVGDAVLRAVYDAALYKLYTRYPNHLGDSATARAAYYRQKAMLKPEALAEEEDERYAPWVEEGRNAAVFQHDMLHVIGFAVEDFETLFRYYNKVGNRRATCLAALKWVMKNRKWGEHRLDKSHYRVQLDSLLHIFGDLDVAGEVAVERYLLMTECSDVSVNDKIAYIHYALSRWGSWQRAGELRNAEKELTSPMYEATLSNKCSTPNTTQHLLFPQLRHLERVTLNIYKVNTTGETDLNPEVEEDYKKMRPLLSSRPLSSLSITPKVLEPWQIERDSILLPSLPLGLYLIEVKTMPGTEVWRTLYHVTDIDVLHFDEGNSRRRLVAVRATDGQPVAGAQLKIVGRNYRGNDRQKWTLTCDDKGEVLFTMPRENYRYTIYPFTKDDKAHPCSAIGYGYARQTSNKTATTRLHLFTDRSIYRPGQTVKMGGWLSITHPSDDCQQVLQGKKVKVSLYDANNKMVSEKTLTTDDYGTFSADFLLPKTTLDGSFRLMATATNDGHGATKSKTLRVEHYKRPTFRIEFPEVDERYHAGDTLLIRAKALTFSGIPVQGAVVNYDVTCRIPLWWRNGISRWSSRSTLYPLETSVYSGEGVTDGDGYVMMEVPLTLPSSYTDTPVPLTKRSYLFSFDVEMQVTDVNGEQQKADMHIPLGSSRAMLTTNLQPQMLSDSLKNIRFTLLNAAGTKVPGMVTYSIDSLPACTVPADSLCPFPLSLASGKHRLVAYSQGDTLRCDFVTFSLHDKRPVETTPEWFYCSSDEFPRDGSDVLLQVGTSDKDVYVVYSIVTADSLLSRGTMLLSDTIVTLPLSYREVDGDGVTFACAWMKNGKLHRWSKRIAKPQPLRRLHTHWTTFRNRLTPGTKEEWTLQLTMPNGQPAQAQMMATLYDHSLDMLHPHQWQVDTWFPRHLAYTQWAASPLMSASGYGRLSWTPLRYHLLEVSYFNDLFFDAFIEEIVHAPHKMLRAGKMMSKNVMYDTLEPVAATAMATATGKSDRHESAEEESADEPLQEVVTRENFSETAFFYPSLLADEQGRVIISFSLPETLTSWRFLGAAHTKGMDVALVTALAEAQKTVMVQPNMPRFVRQGDQLVLKSRVTLQGEESEEVTALMELIDPDTEKVIYKQKRKQKIKGGTTEVLTFNWQADTALPLLICRVRVSGKSGSDGEQHYLPVLPNRELVTASIPLTFDGPSTKQVTLNTLFPKGTTPTLLTMEYTDNPQWLALMALPAVADPADHCSVCLSGAYYSLALARHLLSKQPGARQMFERWRMEEGTATTLAAALEKNEELKSILLAETPWVVEAEQEQEQRRRLGEFFDENSINVRCASLVEQLAKRQTADGAFSWMPQLPGNRMITTQVTQTLLRLKQMTATDGTTTMSRSTANTADRILSKAMTSLDRMAAEEVSRIKEQQRRGEKVGAPDRLTLIWMYLHTLTDGVSGKVKKDIDYLLPLLKKHAAGQDIYEKALTAIIFHRFGAPQVASDYIRSMKEYLVGTPEMGLYYDSHKAGRTLSSYRIPTQVAVIEAMQLITPRDTVTLKGMKRWLLQEKRTQQWDTPINSVNAIHALLSDEPPLATRNVQLALTVDGKALPVPTSTAGVGYVKVSEKLHAAPRRLDITKSTTGTSWGAVYGQRLQQVDEIETAGSDLSVERTIIEKGPYAMGQHVKVRLVIKSRRDLDFVQVKDKRAACMEPMSQLSSARYGCYVTHTDQATLYYIDHLPKGTMVLETEYYIDRIGNYQMGTCTVECAYSPEFRAQAKGITVEVK